MSRPQALDLFAGAGGASMGLYMAGFDVVGVDIKDQPHHPAYHDADYASHFDFWQGDALGWDMKGFDLVWASPPCQAHTAYRTMPNHLSHQDLIAPIRERLERWGGPYIIENVPNAPLREPLTLCGTMFGLGAAGAILKRHRLFESNRLLFAPAPCQHTQAERVIGVYGGHGVDKRRKKNTQFYLLAERKEAMGIDWMLEKELNLAIPPAYSEWLGKQILGGW